jgi:hypothetical protein
MPQAESDTMDSGDPRRTLATTDRVPNIGLVVEFGAQRRKHIKRLKRGEGALAWQIQQAVDQQREELGIDPSAEVVPVVILYRRDEPDYVAIVARPAAREGE